MTASATTRTPRAAPSQPTATAVRPALLGGRGGPLELRRAGRAPARPAAGGGRRRRRVPSTTPVTPSPSDVGEVGDRGQRADPLGGGAGDRPGDRVLRRRLQRAGQPQHLGRRPRPAAGTTSSRVIRPVVTVPVLSSTTVSTRRVFSSTSGPLIRMPSWAPRPVPTIRAVGVASPSAHGQAMISTATAAVNAAGSPAPVPIQNAEGGDGERDDDRHEDAGDPVGQPLHLGLAVLRLLDQPRHLGELGVRADAGGPDDQPAAGVDGRAGDGVARAAPRPARTRRSASRRRPPTSPR